MRLLARCCALLLAAAAMTPGRAQPFALTPFERDSLASATYDEAVAHYAALAEAYPERCTLSDWGETDAGPRLRPFVIGSLAARRAMLTGHPPTLFVNNGIHAGEPCGVDAAMLLARRLVTDAALFARLDTTSLVVIVPAYNVGGMLDRGGGTRANQVGPRAYGFRGNARNLDLNRDFAKQDSRNARSLTELLRALQPDVFVDTHTTNGADYVYDLTVIATQPEKLGPVLGPYLRDTMLPTLYAGVEAAGHPVSPYVYSRGVPQEAGLELFMDTPRYSSGYAALLHSLAFITEAHMLKPFATRVRATEALLDAALAFWLDRRPEIAARREANRQALFARDSVTLAWATDTTRADTLAFRGYAALREPSAVTGAQRLRYDRDRPTVTPTPYRAYARPARAVPRPRAYLIPQAHRHLARQLTADLGATIGEATGFDHGLPLRTLTRDTVLAGTRWRVTDYATAEVPYEGHYPHHGVVAESDTATRLHARAGDLLVALTPRNLRLATALLEPAAPDSYFAWNAFDAYLQRKEHYSAYVFEDEAARLLARDPALRAAFSRKRDGDAAFRQNGGAQLDWIYERSGGAEGGYGRVPVGRVW